MEAFESGALEHAWVVSFLPASPVQREQRCHVFFEIRFVRRPKAYLTLTLQMSSVTSQVSAKTVRQITLKLRSCVRKSDNAVHELRPDSTLKGW